MMLFSSILFSYNKLESYFKHIYLKTNNNYNNIDNELYIKK